ncbi:MAG TPA: hypothetical protein VLI54_02805 [Bacillota bacterium]|nr:hypothetical protein [Bacillota bacterium]
MYKNKNVLQRKKTLPVRKRRRPWLVIILAVLVVAAVVTSIVLLRHKPTTPKDTIHTTANSETKGEPQTSPASTPSQPNSSTPQSSEDASGQKPSQDGTTGQTSLVAPSGNFVSSHKADLSSVPSLQSVCVTTPGASCYITFTQGSTTKSLATQTTDRGGAAYWTWKLQDIGITEGNWTITASATLNGETKTGTDALKLEVTP